MFEKKQLERFSRRDRDIVLDVLKKGVAQLTRLRHPKILSILHPLEESRFFALFNDIAYVNVIQKNVEQVIQVTLEHLLTGCGRRSPFSVGGSEPRAVPSGCTLWQPSAKKQLVPLRH